MRELRELIARNLAGSAEAMPSVCSAHPDVLAAAILLAKEAGVPLLVEATSNQVNQFGGYTGLNPAGFIAFVNAIRARIGAAETTVLFGGDHLGPQVWRARPADEAMAMARDLVAAFVGAGFTKIHLDCSEGCAGEPAQVADAVSAARSAELAAICEATAADPEAVTYMFGTEVPPPGGVRAEDGTHKVVPTTPESARATIAVHRQAFAALGLENSAWSRAAGLVVQPGLEFAPDYIERFDVDAPDRLSAVLDAHPGLSFEAHSTDYQAPDVFPALARRHFAVLKVGPALTHAYRRAVFGLDAIATWVVPSFQRISVTTTMETLMLENPSYWTKHYTGDVAELHLLRHFSYADRIRYYWQQPAAVEAVDRLLSALSGRKLPQPILEQYFTSSVIERANALLAKGFEQDLTRALIHAQIQTALLPYFACYGVKG
ncbi:MAG: class II D-tagatose-bisphosphate aldolase, non-catalytic subunit [Azospirillaceae bacterium]|nr:class II D-tagatose-bisphosphate aldolase, non-catalytic subunit [Azospirillaceae bacterium]